MNGIATQEALRIALVIVFALGMLFIGYLGKRRTRNVSDFFLCNRNVGPWISAFAYGTTYFSAVLFIGYAGKLGWGFGLNTMWIVVGNALLGTLLAWKVLAARTREMTARLGAMTMPEFLAERYGNPALKTIAALIVFIFLVPYSASVYMGLSYLFQHGLSIPYVHALVFMAVVTGIYLVMGGYFALTLTDFIQGLLMLGGVVLMLTMLISRAGGWSAALTGMTQPGTAPALGAPGPIPGWVTLASLAIITSLGPWGLPQMVQKFYSIKSSADVRRATIVATLFALIISFGAYFAGSMTHLFYTHLPVAKAEIDNLMPYFLSEHLPSWMSLVVLLLVLSASMSSLSSIVLVSASAVAIDIYAGKKHKNRSDKSVMLLMRFLCALFICLSFFIAVRKPEAIINLMSISWGVLAGAFLAPYVYGLFWRRANTTGAYAALISGLAVSISLFVKLGPPGIPLSGALGMLVPLLVMPIATLLSKPMPQEHLDRIYGETEDAMPQGVSQAEA